MRVVVVLRSPIFFRFVDRAVSCLAARGHQVVVLSKGGSSEAIERCAAHDARVRVEVYQDEPYWLARVVSGARHLRAFRHWLEPERRWPEFLRRRWATTAFGFPRGLRAVVRVLGLPAFERLLRLLPAGTLLRWFETVAPPHPRVVARLRNLRPDLLVATPLLYPAPSELVTEVEFLKAARRLGVPAAVVVASWDNLSMKGHFPLLPDRVLVWNDQQAAEATALHGLPGERVVAAGAGVFDKWFSDESALPRADFLRGAGLAPGSDYFLYVESSDAAGDERALVERLAAALDAAGARPEQRLVVRRHPSRSDRWPVLEHPRLHVYPERSVVPMVEESNRVFYNTLRHARAVIGLNTTVFLEAAILDRPCVLLRPADKLYFQDGLLHFRYLLDGGFLAPAASEDEAAARLLELGAGADPLAAARRRFVGSFLRPAGRDRPAAEVMADALIELGQISGARVAARPAAPPRAAHEVLR